MTTQRWRYEVLVAQTRVPIPPPGAVVLADPVGAPGNRVVAVVCSVDGEHAADLARLIAIAPDLLAACELGRRHLDVSHPDGKAAYDAMGLAMAKGGGA